MLQRSFTLGVIAACAALAACSQDFPTITPSTQKEQFSAQLTGAGARPVVTGPGAATATIVVQDTNSLTYEVLGTGLVGVNRLQIQAGTAADTGRVMATLFTAATGTNVDSNRVVRAGSISRTGTTFVAPFTYDSVVTRLRAGTLFMVVRTVANPTGAVRGQFTRSAG